MPNVLIFGTGSIGACYSYVLLEGGAQVTAVCRSNYQAAKEHGFKIVSGVWGTVTVKPTVVRRIEEASDTPWDFIFVCSKAFPGSNPSTPDMISAAVKPNTAIVLVQNGIAIEDEYAAAFPSNPIISTVVYLPAAQKSPGNIKMGNIERLEMGTYPARVPESHKQAAQRLLDLIRAGNGTAELVDDIQPLRWKKLMVNAPWNPICALSRSSDVAFMSATPYGQDVIWKCMLEVVAVSNACGYTELTDKEAQGQLARATARIPNKGIEPSMLADIWQGKPIEVEAIVGNMVRIANEKGVEVPYMTMVYTIAKALDESNRRAIATSS